MGFFSRKVTCSVCDGDASLNRLRIANKDWACSKCLKSAGYNTIGPFEDKLPSDMTSNFLKYRLKRSEESKELLKSFNPSKKIGSAIELDDSNNQWLILSSVLGKRDKSIVYNYDEITGFELLEDGDTLSEGGIGRALVGGALFGGTGAVVGGITGKRKNKGICTSLRIKVTLNNMDDSVVYIDLLKTKTPKNGSIYKMHMNYAQEILSVFDLITKKHSPIESSETTSSADDILKFKKLLDADAITQEEYDTKKKELLRL